MMFPEGQKRRLRLAAALTALLLLLAGCGGPKIVDPDVTAEEHRLNAALLIDNRKFAEAERELDQAVLKAPGNAALHLLRGELLQVQNRPDDAAAAYRRGLSAAGDESPEKIALAHRLGLLELLEFDDVDEAKALAASLSKSSLERIDLSGTVALAENRPVAALKIFSRAPTTTSRPGMAAWVRYHAARAYHRLGDKDNTHSALYVAVNHAESIVLRQQIEAFWKEINPPR